MGPAEPDPGNPGEPALFLLHLDFGNAAFNGEARWLEIGVRPNGSTNDFTLLNPRQALTPRPYALLDAVAGTAALALNAMNLIGRLEGDVTGTQDATVVGGLRGVAIAATSPALHQHLRFDGAQWTPGAVALGAWPS